MCLKIHVFGFREILVMRHATTAAHNVVLFSTLIGPFEFEREREGPLNLSAGPKFTMDQSELRMKPRCERPLSHASSQGFQESRRGESKGKFFVLHESFGRLSTRIWSEIYWALWNCYFYCDSGFFLLSRKRLVEWRLASDVRSGLPFHSFRRRSNGFK